MAVRGEWIVNTVVNSIRGTRARASVARQASRYWSSPAGGMWTSNSHWRNGIGDDAFIEVGRDHWSIYEEFARCLHIPSPGTVIEWGAGGGANAVAFGPRSSAFIAADIAPDSLAECAHQLRSTCNTPLETRLIDLTAPERAADGLDNRCDTFLCLYVMELTSSKADAERILRIAERVLAPGGLALIQTKYHTDDPRTRGRPGVRYTRNISLTTTFSIEEFWHLTQRCGLVPRLVTLVPENRLDTRYAYYAITKPRATA